MKTSENIEIISTALCELNKVLNNPKNSTENPFYKKKYAPLGDILSGIRPAMANNGLSIIQNTLSEENKIGIQTMIIHVSGQYIQSDIMWIKSDKDTAQGQGSAITYGRRYQISAMLSIASEDDDDGNSASDKKHSEQTPAPKTTPEVLKNKSGEIELEHGNQVKALEIIGKAKTEDDIKKVLSARAKRIWTADELKAQDDMINIMRQEWAENKALEQTM